MIGQKQSRSKAFFVTPGKVRVRYRIWPASYGLMVVQHAGKIYSIGNGESWSSIDCRTWTKVSDLPESMPDIRAAIYSIDGNIIVAGGWKSATNTYLNSVWSSTDGDDWTEINDDAEFSDRAKMNYWNYDGKIWLGDGQNATGSVQRGYFYSSDGEEWTETDYSALVFGYELSAHCVHDNKMYFAGGQLLSAISGSVFETEDCVTFTDSGKASNDYWGRRYGAGIVSFNETLFFAGGRSSTGRHNDVWISETGQTWDQLIESAPWDPRDEHSLFVFDGRIWVAGGSFGVTSGNDIWYSEDGEIWKENI